MTMPKEVESKKKNEVDNVDSSNENEEEEEYVVEKIMGRRVNKNVVEYYIKWEGYSMDECTWEPADNLHCPELIEAYEKKDGAKKKGPASKTTKRASEKRAASPASDRSSKRRGASVASDSVASETASVEDKKPVVKKEPKKAEGKVGFARGLEPDEIIGASENSGELMLLITWKGGDDADLVPAKEANERCPQKVIKFYEERLTWHTPDANN